ncbi:DUF6386 family protein [Undibacterium sp. Ji50W]|uniref:DUF6386 family protein n=1 Tax=Undibacterium sp. Ji50W TaxID=3413041 RepID=UPI003BF434B0
MNESFPFSTDTATIAIFDVAALKHRLNDVGDWWSVPTFELAEVNLGNVLIIALGQDGTYTVDVTDKTFAEVKCLSGMLKCPSGQIYIGAGEDISGGGFDPENTRHLSGRVIHCPPGTYQVNVSRKGSSISIFFASSQGSGSNAFRQPLELS